MHADVRKTLIDREYQTRTQAEKAQRAAQTGIKGTPAGTGMKQQAPGGESLRSTLERAFGDS